MARRGDISLSREDARVFLMMGAIFFPIGLVILLVTRLAGSGMTAMGLFCLVVGLSYYLRGG